MDLQEEIEQEGLGDKSQVTGQTTSRKGQGSSTWSRERANSNPEQDNSSKDRSTCKPHQGSSSAPSSPPSVHKPVSRVSSDNGRFKVSTTLDSSTVESISASRGSITQGTFHSESSGNPQRSTTTIKTTPIPGIRSKLHLTDTVHQSVKDLDTWIEQLRQCKHLTAGQLKLLFRKAKEVFANQSNLVKVGKSIMNIYLCSTKTFKPDLL